MFRSIRSRLLFWYIGSLFFLAGFFYIVVHILSLKYGTLYFVLLFILFASIGFAIIYGITQSIVHLTSQLQGISRKNIEKRIIHNHGHDEISELSKAFNTLLDRLDDAFNREQQFITDVAHEIKTPLATLKSSFEVTLNKPREGGEYKQVIKESIVEIDRISTVVKNVLDLAWAEAPDSITNGITIDLSALMEEMADITKKMTVRKKISIQSHIEKNVFIQGSRERIAKALLFIIDNAVQYTPQDGIISLELAHHEQLARIAIKDNGIGISKDDLPLIFNRFYRSERTKNISGSGIGLAITKSVIERHHGHIEVKSEIDKGSLFLITLPLAHTNTPSS